MGKVKASRLPEPRLIEIPSLGDHQLMRDISIQLQDAGAVDHLDGDLSGVGIPKDLPD